ncbi:MAG: hypothetical protein EOM87_05035 [Clostridia bacterium]|nr:hypothetical protein [Clostridia bacterium]
MKKLLITLFILVLVFSLTCITAVASADAGDFVKIESETVGFYRLNNDTMTLLFNLPINTYAQVIFDDGGAYYIIKYNGISGYLKKSDVAVGLYVNINNPYSSTAITLNAPKLIYPSVNSNSPSTLATADTLVYIGKISSESIMWFAVKKNSENAIYFVKQSDVYVPQVNPDPDPDPVTPAEDVTPSNNLVKALLIIGIIIPAVIIVFLLFKPRKRRPPHHRYMDDNPRSRRYEDDYYNNDDDYYE